MQIKSELRKSLIAKRKSINNKFEKDYKIAQALYHTKEFQNAKTVLVYVSLDDEIKTDNIIDTVLKNGKNAAVPRCIDHCGNMEFCIISALSDLEEGSFKVREPKSDCPGLIDYSDSIIIVPALCFDRNGFRLGYGKGYYDRFLEQYNNKSIGLCYDEMIVSSVPKDNYDKSVDLIITEKNIINCNDGGNNG